MNNRMKWRELLNLQQGEEKPTLLLVVHSFFVGITIVFYNTAADTQFLMLYDADMLPWVYLGAAGGVTLVGYGYDLLQERTSASRLMVTTLVSLFVSIIGFRVLQLVCPQRFMGPLLMAQLIWAEVVTVLINLEFWALAGKIFDVRQGKRLFGLIATGEVAAGLLSGCSVPLIAGPLGTANLLFLSAAGVVGSFWSLAWILRLWPTTVDQADEDEDEGPLTMLGMLRDPYLRLVCLVSLFSILGYYFVDFAFYDRAETWYPDEKKLAGFLGIYMAISSVVCLFGRAFVSGRLLNRYGLTVGLLGLPAALLTGAGSAGTVGLIAGLGGAFFLFITLTKMLDDTVRTSIEEPSIMILYKPLAPERRIAAQAKIKSYVEPAAVGLAGGVLLILTALYEFNAMHAAMLILPVCIVWGLIASRLKKAYTKTLMNALSCRRLDDVELSLADASTVKVLVQNLASEHPGAVIYAVCLLEKLQHEQLPAMLVNLLTHPRFEVRLDTVQRLEKLGGKEALEPLQACLREEESPRIRGAALCALCSIAEDEMLNMIVPYLTVPETEVRLGAMVGLLRYGGIEGILAASEQLIRLRNGSDPADRILAARVLDDVGIRNYYRPLLPLLKDNDAAVRAAAVKACANVQNPHLWPMLIALLDDPKTRSAAYQTLQHLGPQIIPVLAKSLKISRGETDRQRRMIRLAGSIGGDAIPLLLRHLSDRDCTVRLSVLQALAACRHQVALETNAGVSRQLQQELALAAKTLGVLVDVSSRAGTELLQRALQGEFSRQRERILRIIGLTTDQTAIQLAWHNLTSESGEKRAYAVEIIDNLLPQQLKRSVLPFFGSSSPANILLSLDSQFSRVSCPLPERLRALIAATPADFSAWLRACAIFTACQLKLSALLPDIQSLTSDPQSIICETAQRACAELAG